MKLKEQYFKMTESLDKLSDLPRLFFRLILAYGFFEPAVRKVSDINAIAGWFASMNFPAPTLNAYLAAGTEFAGFILLFLGLGTRLISIPLMIVMLTAVFAVHLGNGFSAGSNGFEIPLYYLLMLFSLLITGAGKYSLDHVIKRKIKG